MRIKILSILFLLSFFLFVFSLNLKVSAQSVTETTLIPPSIDVFANPGDTLTEKVDIRNESSTANTYNLSTENFVPSGDQGFVALTPGSVDSTYSLASWINLSSTTLTIPAHSSQSVNYNIVVPNNAEPGTHDGAITVQTAVNAVPGVANVSSGQVSLILLTVSGNVTENVKVDNFSAPNFSYNGPIPLSLKITDNGDVYEKPSGYILLTNIFGAKVDEISLNGENVLPGASRIMITNWGATGMIGKYTATLIATYGTKNDHNITDTTTFYIFPMWFITTSIVVGCIVLLFVLLIIFGRKRLSKALKVIAQG